MKFVSPMSCLKMINRQSYQRNFRYDTPFNMRHVSHLILRHVSYLISTWDKTSIKNFSFNFCKKWQVVVACLCCKTGVWNLYIFSVAPLHYRQTLKKCSFHSLERMSLCLHHFIFIFFFSQKKVFFLRFWFISKKTDSWDLKMLFGVVFAKLLKKIIREAVC